MKSMKINNLQIQYEDLSTNIKRVKLYKSRGLKEYDNMPIDEYLEQLDIILNETITKLKNDYNLL